MNICIFGASSRSLDEIYYTEAEKFGLLMARHGHTLVFGGGTGGIMGAVARGVHEGGGDIIGIAPRFFDEPGILYKDCTEFIYTDTMRERKQLMEEKSDATVVLPGGIGTYEEFFEILTLKQLGKTRRAIVLLNTEGFFGPMQALMEHTATEKFMSSKCLNIYDLVDTPEQAIEAVERYVPANLDPKTLKHYSD